MNKFTSTALALVLGTALHANATETPNFTLEMLHGIETAIAYDNSHNVNFTLGYESVEEKNCGNLVMGIWSWFPISDKEETKISVEAGFKVDKLEGRVQVIKGNMLHVEDRQDLYLYTVTPYPDFINELIEGETLMYIDETYHDGTFSLIDLTDLEITLSAVMAGCLNRGGDFVESAPVNNSPKTRI